MLLAGLLGAVQGTAQKPAIPRHKAAIVLFDGKNLSQFDTFLPSTGLDMDPKHVFALESGAANVSGTEMGYFITKREHNNHCLRAEFKWGEGTFAPRAGQARDSGML